MLLLHYLVISLLAQAPILKIRKSSSSQIIIHFVIPHLFLCASPWQSIHFISYYCLKKWESVLLLFNDHAFILSSFEWISLFYFYCSLCQDAHFKIYDGLNRCVICRCEYEDGDTLSTLPCKHHYHTDCIKDWLQINKVEHLLNSLYTYFLWFSKGNAYHMNLIIKQSIIKGFVYVILKLSRRFAQCAVLK